MFENCCRLEISPLERYCATGEVSWPLRKEAFMMTKCSICSSQGNTRDSSLVEGLCVNLIFGTRGEAWIYSAHPTGALSITVPLSVRPLSHTHICVYITFNLIILLPPPNPPNRKHTTDRQPKYRK